jgi:hypothetical protein
VNYVVMYGILLVRRMNDLMLIWKKSQILFCQQSIEEMREHWLWDMQWLIQGHTVGSLQSCPSFWHLIWWTVTLFVLGQKHNQHRAGSLDYEKVGKDSNENQAFMEILGSWLGFYNISMISSWNWNLVISSSWFSSQTGDLRAYKKSTNSTRVI